MMLFNKKLLDSAIKQFDFPDGEHLATIQKIIAGWQKSLKNSNLEKTKETSVQGLFLQKFFGEILGYASQVEGLPVYQFVQHPTTEVDATEPDGALGVFAADKKIYRAVIELKDAKTPLDKKQSKNYASPVAQAFSYLSKFDQCDWAIVSNFKEIRLYHKSRGQGYYEVFDILKLHQSSEFERFYFLLCQQNLICENRASILDKLVADTTQQQEDISKVFYRDFKSLRQHLFEHLQVNNPEVARFCLLEKTQKLLDRMIFIFFCEDTYLLPVRLANEVYQLGKKSRVRSDQRVWLEFKHLFQDIDEGRYDVDPPINAYNGGLFAYDAVLNDLVIKDNIWADIVALARYDFESDLNVNILGHIFEQSLTDLEKFKNSLDDVAVVERSKRKKDGIFYTPEYITRYIVEQTVGQYLNDNPDKLETIKILDPACGSGAFLNQAHSFLKTEHEIRTAEKIAQLQEGESLDIEQHITDKSILLNNLFGVDINPESVEITKLALWLKTAKRNEPLQNIDDNIKCGNSLIDDAKVAGDRAFDWQQQFPEIMQSGGFDVIIGNPPYGVIFGELEKNYLEKFDPNVPDYEIYIYFVTRGLNLLKQGGLLSYIFPNTFLSTLYGKKYRNFIVDNFDIVSIVDLSDDVTFEDANVRTCIFTIRKKQTENKTRFYSIHLDNKQFYQTNEFEKSILRENKENWLKLVEYREEVANLVEKLQLHPSLNTFCEVSQGYIPYDKYRGHDEDTIKNRVWHADTKKDETYKPELAGKDVMRYRITWNGVQWVSYGDWLAAPREPRFFTSPRLLIREIVNSKLMCVYTEQEFYNNPAIINVIKQENSDILLLFVLAILNSKLMVWYHAKTNPKAKKGLFPKILVNDVRQLPIPKTTLSQQHSLAQKAQKMLELHKELHESAQQTIEFIQTKYELKKVSKKLEKFWQLGANVFIDELKKQKITFSLSQEEELVQWYRDKQTVLIELEKQINTLDKQIDNEVYQFYGLSDEEINIIENSH